MGVACPPARNTRNGERKGKGDVRGVTVGSEADLAASETLEGSQGWIVARLPRIINLQRSLSLIHVTRALHSEAAVFFVATVSAVSADKAVKSGFDRGHGIFRFAENPDLDHVAGFPVVARCGEPGGDDHPLGVFMKEKAVQREPPTRNSATQ